MMNTTTDRHGTPLRVGDPVLWHHPLVMRDGEPAERGLLRITDFLDEGRLLVRFQKWDPADPPPPGLRAVVDQTEAHWSEHEEPKGGESLPRFDPMWAVPASELEYFGTDPSRAERSL